MTEQRAEARPDQRSRGAVRTAVVWEDLEPVLGSGPLDVVDLGGGTGGAAVRIAEMGHRVTVVDPSPDALAALDRRAREQGLGDQVTAVQGDLDDLLGVVGTDGVDVVLCHGVLEVVRDPAAAVGVLGRALRPHGTLSLLAAQRYAAVVARAMAGHFGQARALLEGEPGGADPGRTGRRFSAEELEQLVADAGLALHSVRGVRVLADLVPGSLLDREPGAADELVALELALAARPELRPLATQLHVVAER